ncbi:MAG: hypothetical protein CK425_10785 [Parachlamydia sp.]|nr:MAG: hypothetical protein CK425_10785 [Parachlamydia sp.]
MIICLLDLFLKKKHSKIFPLFVPSPFIRSTSQSNSGECLKVLLHQSKRDWISCFTINLATFGKFFF